MPRRALGLFVWTALAAALPACTEGALWERGRLSVQDGGVAGPPADEGQLHTYSVGDVFCTTPSKERIAPFKILIVFDYSRSMYDQPDGRPGNDPGKVRIQAAQDFVMSHIDPNLSYGFVGFSSDVVDINGAKFISDQPSLAAIFNKLLSWPTYMGSPGPNDTGTNYSKILEWCRTAILKDMALPEHVPETAYGILFITDGKPTEPGTAGDYAARVADTKRIITGCDAPDDPARPPLANLIAWLRTYYINTTGTLDPVADDLLRRMAEGPSTDPCVEDNNWGHGAYTLVTNMQDLVFTVSLPVMRTVFQAETQGVVPLNYHTRVAWRDGEMVLAPDSDGDGLTDFEEAARPVGEWASARDRFDTNGDGIGDLVHFLTGTPPNRLVADLPKPRPPVTNTLGLFVDPGLISETPADRDADGLTDAEESLLGTDPTLADTDGDRFSDWVEVRFRLNPLDPSDAQADPDADGVTSANELISGMDPWHAEPVDFRERFAYRFALGRDFPLDETGPDGAPRRRTCYEFSLGNLPVLTRTPSPAAPQPLNVLELNFLDRTPIAKDRGDLVRRRQVFYANPALDAASDYRIVRRLPDYW